MIFKVIQGHRRSRRSILLLAARIVTVCCIGWLPRWLQRVVGRFSYTLIAQITARISINFWNESCIIVESVYGGINVDEQLRFEPAMSSNEQLRT